MAKNNEELRNTRKDIFSELLKFLRSKNTKPNIWDRPIAITLVGGVALTLITTLWNSLETRRQDDVEYKRAIFKDVYIKEQIELIKNFPKAFDNTGTIVNSWLTHILWVAEEKNEKNTRSNVIKKWEEEIKRLQHKYESSEPLEGMLKQIQVMFACQTLRNSAQILYEKWQEFTQLHHTVNRDYNDGEKIIASDAKQYESKRKELLKQLERRKDIVIEGMSYEMAGIRVGLVQCLP